MRTTFTARRSGSAVTVSAAVRGDGYPEHRRTAFRLVVHGADVSEVRLDGTATPRDGGGWLLRTAAAPFEVELTPAWYGPARRSGALGGRARGARRRRRAAPGGTVGAWEPTASGCWTTSTRPTG